MTAWIAGVAVAALVIVGVVVWGLARRRQSPGRLAAVTSSATLTNASAVRQADQQADSQRKAA